MWFSLFSFSSFLRLIGLIEGVVWRGWMTSLPCLFRILWRREAGHSWRTQDGDGKQGNKVPGGLTGREPSYSIRTNCSRYLEGALCFGLPVVLIPWFLVLIWLQVLIVVFFPSFSPQLFLSKCLPHPLRGGARQLVSSIFSFFFLSFDLSSLLSFFLDFLSCLYFIECVCRIQYDDTTLHCMIARLSVFTAYVRSISVAGVVLRLHNLYLF